MRFVLLLLAAASLFHTNPAKALIVTNGETIQVYGDFSADPYAIVTATLIVNSNTNFGSYPFPQFQAYFTAGASVDGFSVSACGSNIPGPCAPYNPQTAFLISASSPTIAVSTYFNAQAYNFSCFVGLQGCLPNIPLPDPAGTTFVDVELQNSGFYFSAVAALPEPSTWAMLLIGFVAISALSTSGRCTTKQAPRGI